MKSVQFPAANLKIGVAVAFDERLEALLSSANQLARATGSVLRLIHVCDSWTKSHLASAVETGPAELVKALRDESERVATRRLASLARSFPEAVETSVESGDVVRTLVSDAEENGVGLLVIGASKGGISGTSMGFSTAVSLISESPVPVMVINEDAELKSSADSLTFLVADDFSDVAKAGLGLGFALATAVRGSTLVHAHVETFAELQLQRKGTGHAAASNAKPFDLTNLISRAEEQMMTRAQQMASLLESSGGHYQMEIVTGAVPDELERTALACRADVAIFGQHKVFHRHGMHVGQVPFKAMLAQGRPVIVVPHAGSV